MCGIVGLVGEAVRSGDGDRRVKGMLADLAHRGPDHRATFTDGPVSLGHARLSIIDLSSASDQPFVDDATGVVLVYNGEVYNYRELRRDLEARGQRFQTEGDTEVVLRSYLAEGIASFSRLNGMFALALWDPRVQRLVLARDPIGIKPMHVHADPASRTLAFASEAKALLDGLPAFTLDPVGLASYLRFHYTAGPQTIVKGIERLPPGEAWVVDPDGQVLERRAFATQEAPAPAIVPDAKALWGKLEEAVRRQMVADVEVGAFLSGGIDSSIVALLAAKVSQAQLRTFTVGFDAGTSTGDDERAPAARLADSIGARNEAIEVRGDDVRREFGTMSWHYDGPLGEGGCIPNYFVGRLAARSVKVVLAGEGGDEVFSGYAWHAVHRRSERVARRLPHPGWAARLGERTRFRALTRRDRSERYAALIEWTPPPVLATAGLPTPGLGPMVAQEDPMHMDRRTLLRDCYLVKADRMTMAHGLEQRVPLLDLELVRYAEGLPLESKAGPPAKKILREAARPWLGAVADRPKQGFGTPMAPWSAGPLADGIEAALADPGVVRSGLVGASTWRALAVSAQASPRFQQRWLLFALDAWVAEVVRRKPGLR